MPYKDKKAQLASQRKYRAENRDAVLERCKLNRQRHRMNALEAYGAWCHCCNERRLEFLCIDHINGGGNQHRKEIKSNSSDFLFRWLARHKFPAGFRVLCHNCNQSLSAYGYCPHEMEAISE